VGSLGAEHRASDSIHVERVWRAEGTGPGRMLSVTNSNWEIVVTEHGGGSEVFVRGPETRTRLVDVPRDGRALGIVFAHGTVMPHLPVPRLRDSAVAAREVSARRVILRGDAWELPTYENAEDLVAALARAGVLRRDPMVADVAAGADDHGLTPRTVQRRVAAATGLTQGAIRQIERARSAADMLQRGTPALAVVHALGYYDQPHLARSLTRFIGRSATELARPDPDVPLSLLYKTPGWDHF
jgi:methylphosphotriester-DNA--protein-cysteine methyltransferase